MEGLRGFVKGPAVLVTSASDFAGLGNFPHLFSGPIRGYKGAYKGLSGLMRGYKVSFCWRPLNVFWKGVKALWRPFKGPRAQLAIVLVM